MKNKKNLFIILITIIGLYILISITMIFVSNNRYKKTVFLGESAKLSVINGKFKMSYEDVKINKQKVKIYFENNIIDGYIQTKVEASTELVNSLHAYTKDGKYLLFESFLIAYTKDLNIDFITLDIEYYDDNSDGKIEVNEIIRKEVGEGFVLQVHSRQTIVRSNPQIASSVRNDGGDTIGRKSVLDRVGVHIECLHIHLHQTLVAGNPHVVASS